MPGQPLRWPLRRFIAASLLVLLAAHAVNAGTVYTQTIYRWTAFSTQANDYFCTAAVVQNIRNLATGQSRRDRSQQAAMYAFGRAHNLYAYLRPGVDPQGVEAMLEQYIPGSDWRQIRAGSLQGALQSAARGMRRTGLPAVLFVAGGKHVWTMNGYTATADPASARSFRVTHIRFSGPFYPKQKAHLGWFDLRPNNIRSVERLGQAFFPYRNKQAFGGYRWTPWNGYYVAVVPWSIGDEPTPTPTPTPTPSPTPTTQPTPTPSPEATPQPTSGPTSEPTTEPSLPTTPAPTFEDAAAG